MLRAGLCIGCGLDGFMRQEHVFTGNCGYVEYSCDRCNSRWRILNDHERRAAPRLEPTIESHRIDAEVSLYRP